MSNKDTSFSFVSELQDAVDFIHITPERTLYIPSQCPDTGLGESAALRLLAPYILGDAAKLGAEDALAHMDPPTPWITWATTLWNARLNQNLLHEATAPFALKAEERALEWLLPFFGMNGGHMCSGSTLANLTALWVARDSKEIRRIVASEAAHLSIEKAASAKLWTSEMLGRTVDKCLQIFGGWGYMWEYPIAKAYAEARVERIAGGSSEVMKSIIIKSLFKDLGIESEFN